VARLRSAAGTVKYRTFSTTFDIGNEMEIREHVMFAAPHLIPDDDEDEQDRAFNNELNDQQQNIFEPATTITQSEQPVSQSDKLQQTREENHSDFLTEVPPQPTPNVIEDDEGRLAGESNQADFLRWHYRLGHLSFAKIKLLALLKILPRKLAVVKPPRCAGCLYGSMTRRPWRTKISAEQGQIAHCPGSWRMHFCGSVGVSAPRICCSVERKINKKTLQGSYCVRGSQKSIILCSSTFSEFWKF
jgi:hypothetical protein